MTVNTLDQRLGDAAQTRRDYRVELLTVGVIAGFIGGWFLFGANQPLANDGYITNVFTELLSVGMTIFVLNELTKRREISELKKRLVRQAGSVNHAIAINAVEELRENSWLTYKDSEALLIGARLRMTNLEDASLTYANLQNAYFRYANLKNAHLRYANMRHTNLEKANLTNAILREADLSGSNMLGANLAGVRLEAAKLYGTNLTLANLRNVDLASVEFNESTILPDAGINDFNITWTPETDMTRYTDPNHPDFWQPDWVATGFESYVVWEKAGSPKPNAD